MKTKFKKKTGSKGHLGKALSYEQLVGLRAELQLLRENPPVVIATPGQREGDILGFVRGLRLSARLAYFLRERLSATSFEVSWAHLLDEDGAACSPECDIVIHSKGHHHQWNGNAHPIMDFRFIPASAAKAVVSCKSSLTSVEKRYPKTLRKFGVKSVFLFAECCEESRFKTLVTSARKAGYAGLCCLYFTTPGTAGFKSDEQQYLDFAEAVSKALGP